MQSHNKAVLDVFIKNRFLYSVQRYFVHFFSKYLARQLQHLLRLIRIRVLQQLARLVMRLLEHLRVCQTFRPVREFPDPFGR